MSTHNICFCSKVPFLTAIAQIYTDIMSIKGQYLCITSSIQQDTYTWNDFVI